MLHSYFQLLNRNLPALIIHHSRSTSVHSSKFLYQSEEDIKACKELNEAKAQAVKDLTMSLIEQSLDKEEEKYQNQISQIMEVFYSIDEDKRPDKLLPIQLDYLVKMKKPRLIANYIKSLAKAQIKGKIEKERREEIKQAILNSPKPPFGVVFDEEDKPIYKFHNISLVSSYEVGKRSKAFEIARIAQAKVLSSCKVVIDFQYDDQMSAKQHIVCSGEVQHIIGLTRKSRDPVELYFCGYNPSSPTATFLSLELGDISKYVIETTPKSYLEIFPKEQLVYLSAESENILEFNIDDIYIIGGMIDAQTNEPLSFMKAQKEGLRTARLPLDEYFTIRNEAKSFRMSQVFGIISTLNETNGDMKKALAGNIVKRILTNKELEIAHQKYLKSQSELDEKLRNKFNLSDEELEVMNLMSEYYKRTLKK